MRIAQDLASPKAVMSRLADPEDYRVAEPQPMSRGECLRAGLIGEVRVPADWARFPTDDQYDVVGVWTPTGPAIRWRTSPKVRGELLFAGEDVQSRKVGRISFRDGEVIVDDNVSKSYGNSTPRSGRSYDHVQSWFRQNAALAAFVLVVGLVVSIAAVVSYRNLDNERRADVGVEIAKLGFQFVAIVVAGSLIKLTIDNSEAWAGHRRALDGVRAQHVRRLIDASHSSEIARVRIMANRTVKTWSEESEKLVSAYVDLRDLQHDVLSFPRPTELFIDWERIRFHVDIMIAYLGTMVDEFSENKKRLSEMQLRAESEELSEQERLAEQGRVWGELQSLDRLGDLVGCKSTGAYGNFRSSYQRALEAMRANMANRKVAD